MDMNENTHPICIYKPNTLYNKNRTIFAFDAFIKNNFLYLVMPLYKNSPSTYQIKTFVNNGKISLYNNIIKNRYEATRILIYKIDSSATTDHICAIIYNNRKFTVSQKNMPTDLFDNSFLSLTTLCKNDYALIQPFIKYYESNGVERFYIYYNGIITTDIQKNITKICREFEIPIQKIVFIEWNFDYLHNNSMYSNHHAQLGQIHHAIYFFGKNTSEYMIFCDMDEYFYIKNSTIEKLLRTNKLVDTFTFHNSWARTLNNDITTHTTHEFPSTFECSKHLHRYGWRSKCIHKVSSIKTIGIHTDDKYTKQKYLTSPNHIMFHFYNWTQPKRSINSIEGGVVFHKITL